LLRAESVVGHHRAGKEEGRVHYIARVASQLHDVLAGFLSIDLHTDITAVAPKIITRTKLNLGYVRCNVLAQWSIAQAIDLPIAGPPYASALPPQPDIFPACTGLDDAQKTPLNLAQNI
jgi:hypothetical protein